MRGGRRGIEREGDEKVYEYEGRENMKRREEEREELDFYQEEVFTF